MVLMVLVLRPEGPCERAERRGRLRLLLLIFFPRDVPPCHIPGDHKLSLTKTIKTKRVLEASAEESDFRQLGLNQRFRLLQAKISPQKVGSHEIHSRSKKSYQDWKFLEGVSLRRRAYNQRLHKI